MDGDYNIYEADHVVRFDEKDVKRILERESKEQMRILIVEDDEALSVEIADFLRRWGHGAYRATDFAHILSYMEKLHPHLVLLDINLPYYDGFYWCQKIREISEVPILFISSRDSDSDQIMAVAHGGDDYVEKPFRLELLKAKIDAALRRAYRYKMRDRVYLSPDLCFVYDRGALIYREKEVELTRSEKKILIRLMEERPGVVSREELMNTLWNTDEFVSEGTLTTLVSRLRGKIHAACHTDLIGTRKGEGYFVE